MQPGEALVAVFVLGTTAQTAAILYGDGANDTFPGGVWTARPRRIGQTIVNAGPQDVILRLECSND